MVRGVPSWKIRDGKVSEIEHQLDLIADAKKKITTLEMDLLILLDKLTDSEDAELHRRYWNNTTQKFDPKYTMLMSIKIHGAGRR